MADRQISVSLLTTIAERAGAHPQLEAAVVATVRSTLPRVIQAVLRDMFPGETVRLYVPKIGGESREDRNERIAALLESGATPEQIAKAERITVRHARRLRGRLRGPGTP